VNGTVPEARVRSPINELRTRELVHDGSDDLVLLVQSFADDDPRARDIMH